MTNFRIGIGYDVHKLVPNRKLIIGGVTIPHKLGSLGLKVPIGIPVLSVKVISPNEK